MPAECYTDDDETETKFIRTRVSNERRKTGKASSVWHGRWNWNPRKTKQRMAGRRQGLLSDGVSDGRARSEQPGTIRPGLPRWWNDIVF